MNQIILLGRLGGDPETREVGDTSVTSVRLATDESYVKKDGTRVNDTEWHDLEIWGKQGEVIAKYTSKGSQLLITGRIKTNSWEKDGEKHFRKIIRVSNFEFVDSKKNTENNDTNTNGDTSDDDLPF